jgi:hypothetical protein
VDKTARPTTTVVSVLELAATVERFVALQFQWQLQHTDNSWLHSASRLAVLLALSSMVNTILSMVSCRSARHRTLVTLIGGEEIVGLTKIAILATHALTDK